MKSGKKNKNTRIKRDNISGRQQKTDQKRRDAARKVRQWSIPEFRELMDSQGIFRAYIIFENGVFTLSHPDLLEPLQSFFELSQDFSNHEGVFIGREPGIDSLFFAFVHDTRRGLSQGGLRFWGYENLAEVLTDGLRLAQGMTRKNALAGLWWGGGKGIITLPERFQHPNEFGINSPELSEERWQYFQAYGRFVASLGGIYYTAEDVGTFTRDMEALLSQNRFTTCVPSTFGGSGNPSPFTARGVFRAMEAAWQFLEKSDLQGVKVAVQGAGNVGKPLIYDLYRAGAEIWVTDINRDNLVELKEQLPKLHIVDDPEAIFDQAADVFAPCARGAVVNVNTIPRLKANGIRLVCGAANNILKEPRDADRLRENGIGYVPDFLCNRMGIVNCADEWMGYMESDVQVAAEKVYPDTLRVFKHAQNLAINTAKAADHLADIAAAELHPLMSHRGRRLIDQLIYSNWAGFDGKNTPVSEKDPLHDAFDHALDEESIRHSWHSSDIFRGSNPVIAAAPISTAGAPDLASFFIPLLMDIRARSLRQMKGRNPRRLIGADHGGLSLQNAVERATPQSRESIGRADFREMCNDHHGRNDAAIRKQLDLLGIGHDPQLWLDPMNRRGQEVVQALFDTLNQARLVERKDYFSFYNPNRGTGLVKQDVVMEPPTTVRYKINFAVHRSEAVIETLCFLPELILGAVAIAVDANGSYSHLNGKTAVNPLNGRRLPIVLAEDLALRAQFLVPAHSAEDDRLAKQLNIAERIAVYDELGNIAERHQDIVDGVDTRETVVRRLEGNISTEIGSWNVPRCARTETMVIENITQQLFVDIQAMRPHLRRQIESGRVSFNRDHWRQHVLNFIDQFEYWCISRQHWWGNRVPVAANQEVLSTWFSMTAMALRGAGWPQNSQPQLIDEVYCTPQLLERWIIPAQLVSLAITGNPLFTRIHVYGTLQTVERQLQEIENGDSAKTTGEDLERFVMRIARKPMKIDSGNQVQPKALIRRFGADALRLGYLLCSDTGEKNTLTLSESQLRLARKSIKLLSAKVGGVFHRTRATHNNMTATLLDDWIVGCSQDALALAQQYYDVQDFHAIGELLIDTIDQFKQYVNIALKRKKNRLGSIRSTVATVISIMNEAFSPVAPYIFQKLSNYIRMEKAEGEATTDQRWLKFLVAALSAESGTVQITSLDGLLMQRLGDNKDELQQLTRADIRITERPKAGAATQFGPCLLVRPGKLQPQKNGSALLQWYWKQHDKANKKEEVKKKK